MNRPQNRKFLMQKHQESFWLRENRKSELFRWFLKLSSRAYQAALLGLFCCFFIATHSGYNLALAQTDFGAPKSDPTQQQDFRKQLDKWMLKAYEGDRDAQFKVGVLFANDQFEKPDYEQAVYWYKQAARQDHVLAQYNLGHQYLTGVGVIKNESTAMQWWLKAAENDHALAQFNVGRAYYLGIGLATDHSLSKYWFERAAYNNEAKSIDILKQLGWSSGEISNKPAAPKASSKAKLARQSNSTQAEPKSIASLVEKVPVDDSPNTSLTSKIIPIAESDQESKGDSNTPSPVANKPEVVSAKPRAVDVEHKAVKVEPKAVKVEHKAVAAKPKAVISNRASSSVAPKPSSKTQAAKDHPAKPRLTPANLGRSVALYTNPKIRSVLIAVIDDPKTIQVVEYADDWSIVQSTVGFPVWIHGDFIDVENKVGTITGHNVNARSVPIITNGTVVGRLDKGEQVTVLSKRKEWFRAIAPTHFEAWIKTGDYDATVIASTVTNSTNKTKPKPKAATRVANTDQEKTIRRPKTPATTSAQPIANTIINDNAWLFSQPAENVTLQLSSLDAVAKAERFVSQKKFVDNAELHRFTTTSNNILWTYFLYGSYPDSEKAENGKLEIGEKGAWIRTFAKLQQNSCDVWKTQQPPPPELKKYCAK